jgi:NADH-quinone oxidoreductase subunit J
MADFLFFVIAAVTALCGIATVASQNIVRTATWLLFTLAGVSAIFFLLAADIVGAVQLLVYVGGTLVLVVFGVMLTAQGPFITMKTSSAEWAISATVGLLLLGVLGTGIYSIQDLGPSAPHAGSRLIEHVKQRQRLTGRDDNPATSPYSAVIGQGFIGAPVGPPHVERPGGEPKAVRAHYLLPFEIVSIHLLVVLIGAAYLARAKRRREAPL